MATLFAATHPERSIALVLARHGRLLARAWTTRSGRPT